MHRQKLTDINNFFIVGINYRKTDASLRGKFAINEDQYLQLLHTAQSFNIKEFFVLSTCNRTEIYGFAENATQLSNLLCTQTEGSIEQFNEKAYVKKGRPALEHLFNVSAGLDSQILGDYEIVGQLKQAVKFSKAHNFIDTYLERIINAALQSSKEIKNTTSLSDGTVSVSFAAIQFIKEKITDIRNKKILLLGVGKIGGNTCKNLVDYLNTTNITLINRTEEKARILATELGLQYAPAKDLANQITQADIIVVATNAAKPIVLKKHLTGNTEKLIIDLSIPYNVEEGASELPGITLLNVDELSKIKDDTLQKRKAAVPKAKTIIATHIHDFIDWHQMRKNVPVLKAVKNKLQQMHNCGLYIAAKAQQNNSCDISTAPEQKIQKVIDGMAVKMRNHATYGCHYIEAINDFIAPTASN
ncbi:glutamyl-tRNA reductase [Ferruginibacter lapsinanis]|uniref:glutamyl-tRNA reductase n=1 Tax=Ferruginibacter lapsinanis TaxID=563172 RepID=UPI001E5715C2|nr:glutamyl-tRNA reductase [Ferruginibacter lapsinanis]UEG48982.1 glutamyl-tRNA reductase [Ferruginibacter lapsinanis]